MSIYSSYAAAPRVSKQQARQQLQPATKPIHPSYPRFDGNGQSVGLTAQPRPVMNYASASPDPMLDLLQAMGGMDSLFGMPSASPLSGIDGMSFQSPALAPPVSFAPSQPPQSQGGSSKEAQPDSAEKKPFSFSISGIMDRVFSKDVGIAVGIGGLLLGGFLWLREVAERIQGKEGNSPRDPRDYPDNTKAWDIE